LLKICRNTCHTFKDLKIYESLINNLGLDGISGDESIAEVEDNEECLSADTHPPRPYHKDKGPILYEGSTTMPQHRKLVIHTRIINLPFRSAAVNSIIRKIDKRYSQWIEGLEQLGKTTQSFHQQNLIAVLEDTHRYKRGLPIDFYNMDWLEGLTPRKWMDLQNSMKPHWFVLDRAFE